jgi:Predicted oxidoreductases of the aldo/keto reductase family
VIPLQPFGGTGHSSTRIIFGAAAFWKCTPAIGERTLAMLLEHGINHIDVAASYGEAEDHVGPWMERHRDRFFLATKTGERGYEGAKAELKRSLERLRVDSVDLWQLHNLVDPAEWETAMGPGGALEAAIEARDKGLVKFIGVTGHGVTVAEMHRRSLERFPFDSVLLPLNYTMMQNPTYAADFDVLTQTCREQGVAMQTIKSLAVGAWGEGDQRTTRTWYEALTEQPEIDLAVHWVLGHEEMFLNTSSDIGLLAKILDATERYEAPPTEAEMDALVTRAAMSPLFV